MFIIYIHFIMIYAYFSILLLNLITDYFYSLNLITIFSSFFNCYDIHRNLSAIFHSSYDNSISNFQQLNQHTIIIILFLLFGSLILIHIIVIFYVRIIIIIYVCVVVLSCCYWLILWYFRNLFSQACVSLIAFLSILKNHDIFIYTFASPVISFTVFTDSSSELKQKVKACLFYFSMIIFDHLAYVFMFQ